MACCLFTRWAGQCRIPPASCAMDRLNPDLTQPEPLQRNDIFFAPEIFASVGTIPTLRALVNRMSGWPCQVKEFVDNVFLYECGRIRRSVANLQVNQHRARRALCRSVAAGQRLSACWRARGEPTGSGGLRRATRGGRGCGRHCVARLALASPRLAVAALDRIHRKLAACSCSGERPPVPVLDTRDERGDRADIPANPRRDRH